MAIDRQNHNQLLGGTHMTKWFFEEPGHLSDFRDPANWHAAMAQEAQDIVLLLLATVLKKNPSDITEAEIRAYGPELAYVNPIWEELDPAAETVAIRAWGAFPRAVARGGPWKEFQPTKVDPTGIYRAVEHLGDGDFSAGTFIDSQDRVLHLPVRDRQDEYVEWHASRDQDGNITKLTFVAEGYDYFAKLFEYDEQRVVEIYKEFINDNTIKTDHLRAPNGIYRREPSGRRREVVAPGGFNPRNRLNISDGIVHLSHRANSLGAEVNLAGVSGVARKISSGELLDGSDAEKLLCCNAGGNPNRNSDPLISQQAYAQVLGSYRYTLANPVGLYIAGVDEQGLLLPDNKTPVPRDWWTIVRGADLWDVTKSRVLRLELAIPKSEQLTISDLTIGGENVEHAGQIAELLSVHLFVTRWKRNSMSVGPKVACEATCCVKDGSDQLAFADATGGCANGWSPKFPDLLTSSLTPAAMLGPAGAQPIVAAPASASRHSRR
jgi:hypothetical protein